MFKIKTKEYILDLFSETPNTTHKYSKNDIIKNEGDVCTSVGIVIEGTIDIKRMLGTKVINVASFGLGSLFGEVIAFSDVAYYPATVMASTNCEVIYILKKDFIHFCMQNEEFLSRFMNSLTNKILLLNKTITNQTFTSIRQKICNYLVTEYNIQNSLTIKLSVTKEKLSQMLGINRPSLSRELINLKEDGLIDYSKDTITIKNLNAIEDTLL